MSKEDFYDLTPDEVMNALEKAGFSPTGQFTQLNSYENRVFDIRLEPDTVGAPRVVAKFYRPGRWSQQTILEEHQFLNDLATSGLPVVAPLQLRNNSTLDIDNNIWFAVFPRAMGRMVDEFQLEDFRKLGRTLARLHNIGAEKRAPNRPKFTAKTYGDDSLLVLQNRIAPEVKSRYNAAAQEILKQLKAQLPEMKSFRIHGDCHRGNILKTDFKDRPSEFFFVDFDDCCTGPAVQDFWMLLSDSEKSPEGAAELDTLLDGYTELRDFDETELELISPLRGLRILYYAGWIARRWEDPSFPKLFPQFEEYNYWASETEALERIARDL